MPTSLVNDCRQILTEIVFVEINAINVHNDVNNVDDIPASWSPPFPTRDIRAIEWIAADDSTGATRWQILAIHGLARSIIADRLQTSKPPRRNTYYSILCYIILYYMILHHIVYPQAALPRTCTCRCKLEAGKVGSACSPRDSSTPA